MHRAVRALFSTECGELHIGDRNGWTSYIDFIRPEELADEHTMKGTDAHGRRFIVFKCTVRSAGAPPRRLFTTLFQRYRSDATLYHTAGHYGTLLLTTVGGASPEQVEHLCELLHTGRLDLTVDDMRRLSVGYRDSAEIGALDPTHVDTVTVGWAA